MAVRKLGLRAQKRNEKRHHVMRRSKRAKSRFAELFLGALMWLVGALGLLIPLFGHAYVFSTNSNGMVFHWAAPVRPVFYANHLNSSGLGYADVFNSFTQSFSRWKYGGTANLDFNYYQASTHPALSACDAISSVSFTTQAGTSAILGGSAGSTIAVTSVCTYISDGTIVGADVEFNDAVFHFTTTPTDSTQNGAKTVYLENVATHEFGHAYGLGHSAVLQSTMLYLEAHSQAKPSCDDLEGLSQLYPLSSFAGVRGTLAGTVTGTGVGGAGSGSVFGAHVLAISKARGTVVAAAITQPNGVFNINNLEPGDYYVMIEPFSSTDALEPLCGGDASGCYYGTVNSSSFCPGSTPFKRMFVESSAGTLLSAHVNAGQATLVDATKTKVGCQAMTDPFSGVAAASGTAPAIISNNAGAEASAAVRGVLGQAGTTGATGDTQYFMLSNVKGAIKAKLLGYSLYGPFDPEVAILNNALSVMGATTEDVFSSSGGYTNYDSTAAYDASALAPANYYVRVKNLADFYGAASTLYPGGSAGLVDTVRYFALIVTINDSTTILPVLANNSRCEASNDPPAFTDQGPGALPTDASGGGAGGGRDGGGLFGCGMIDARGGHQEQTSSRSGAVEFFVSEWGLLGLIAVVRFGRRRLLHSPSPHVLA